MLNVQSFDSASFLGLFLIKSVRALWNDEELGDLSDLFEDLGVLVFLGVLGLFGFRVFWGDYGW